MRLIALGCSVPLFVASIASGQTLELGAVTSQCDATATFCTATPTADGFSVDFGTGPDDARGWPSRVR